jgi:hypothetical protein
VNGVLRLKDVWRHSRAPLKNPPPHVGGYGLPAKLESASTIQKKLECFCSPAIISIKSFEILGGKMGSLFS